MTTSRAPNPLVPSIAVGGAGAVWGCFWYPARYFEAQGLDDGLFSTSLFAVTVLALLPLAALRWRNWRRTAAPLLRVGLWTGLAFALYVNSLVLTEVVRALLLFYLTPIWSTVLGIAMLGERLTMGRICAISLGLAGGLVILGFDLGIPLPRNTGDWVAIAAGLSWSVASVHMVRAADVPLSGQAFAYALGSLVMSALVMAWLAPAGAVSDLPALGTGALVALLVFALLVNLPCMTALIWGAGRLSPTRVGILLCLELVFGVASAALLTAEPFGMREAIGTALILAAVLTEVALPGNA